MPDTESEFLALKPPACSCAHCSSMCTHPCWGTPKNIRKLIDAGYGAWLCVDYWDGETPIYIIAPALKGYEGGDAPWDNRSDAGCTFWTNGLCDLHDQGLKPLEGVVAYHDRIAGVSHRIHEWVARQWDTDEGRALVAEWQVNFQERGTP